MTITQSSKDENLLKEIEVELVEVTKTFIKLLKDFEEKGIISSAQYTELVKEKRKFLEG